MKAFQSKRFIKSVVKENLFSTASSCLSFWMSWARLRSSEFSGQGLRIEGY
jgi:hypothetical protein